MTALLLLGTLDTKGTEYAYLRERVRGHGVEVVLADVGLGEPAGVDPDLSRIEVAAETGADPVKLLAAGDRGAAVEAMAEAATALAVRLHREGRIGGVLAAGGSGGTTIATRAMRALPVGVPKVMVSTMASGDVARLCRRDGHDADVLGRRHRRDESISARILANAAAAVVGMASARRGAGRRRGRPLIGATMFGVTTPCVTARARVAGGARLRGAGLPRDRHGRPGAGGARSRGASSPACST